MESRTRLGGWLGKIVRDSLGYHIRVVYMQINNCKSVKVLEAKANVEGLKAFTNIYRPSNIDVEVESNAFEVINVITIESVEFTEVENTNVEVHLLVEVFRVTTSNSCRRAVNNVTNSQGCWL